MRKRECGLKAELNEVDKRAANQVQRREIYWFKLKPNSKGAKHEQKTIKT